MNTTAYKTEMLADTVEDTINMPVQVVNRMKKNEYFLLLLLCIVATMMFLN